MTQQSKQIKLYVCPTCHGRYCLACRDCAGRGSILPWRFAEIEKERLEKEKERQEWAEEYQREIAAKKARMAMLVAGMMAIASDREK